MADTDSTVLRLTGVGIPEYSARGLTQTLEPIDSAGVVRRTINGSLVDLSDASFRKYRSTITGNDQLAPGFNGLWPGQVVTVDCIAELAYYTATSGATAERSVVSGSSRTEGDWTYYRPQLTMMVTAFSMDTDEWGASCGWSLALEEI